MSFPVRPVLAALLLAGIASLLTACDYAKYSPGLNPQFRAGFGNTPPGYTNADVDRDSINNQQEVHTPIGVGSAASLKHASPTAQLQSAPAGKSAATSQTASGQLGSINNNEPTNAASTAPHANGNGNGATTPPMQ